MIVKHRVIFNQPTSEIESLLLTKGYEYHDFSTPSRPMLENVEQKRKVIIEGRTLIFIHLVNPCKLILDRLRLGLIG